MENKYGRIPDPSKFSLKAYINDSQGCLGIFYDDTLIDEWCINLPSGCIYEPRIDLIEYEGAQLFLRWVTLCYSDTEKYIEGQLWMEYKNDIGIKIKTKILVFKFEF